MDFAFPIDDIITSTLSPTLAYGGSFAVTTTAAVFFDTKGSSLFSPRFFSMFLSEESVRTDFVSPVPWRPTTSPYPSTWFSRNPSIYARSRIFTVTSGYADTAASMTRKTVISACFDNLIIISLCQLVQHFFQVIDDDLLLLVLAQLC